MSGDKIIEVALPAAVSLSSVRARFYSADYRFVDYTIQTFNGATWDTAAIVTGNTSADVTTAIGAVTTDRFRLVATCLGQH